MAHNYDYLISPLFPHQKWWGFLFNKMEQRIRRCPYRNDECEREEINDSVLKHMCEGDSYFKCFEYQKIYENRDVKDWADCFV